MKAIKTITIAALCILALSACARYTSSEKRPAGVSAKDVNEASYMIGYNFGQFISGNKMGALNLAMIDKGIKDACKGVKIDDEEFMNVMDGYMDKIRTAHKETNAAEAETFFAKNRDAEGVFTTESGLQYKIVREGSGAYPAADDKVEVNYEGSLLDGTIFESSFESGQPVQFGLNQVIKGWGEGLQYINEGGEIILWIPAELAYGEYGAGAAIGPNQALKFRVELLSIIKDEEPAAGENN